MITSRSLCLAIMLSSLWIVPNTCFSEDTVEFMTGARATGTVKAIRKDEREFDLEIKLGNKSVVRSYSFDKIHAVTLNGVRHVITEMKTEGGDESDVERSPKEIQALIEGEGATKPEWYDSVSLDYPESLDLNWPLKPTQEGWNNQLNVGQYRWDIINPNPSRWRSGMVLIYKVMEGHRDDSALKTRDMSVLGEMYFELFQDYARAAYWFQQANIQMPSPHAIHLAECYWRLGNKTMAMDMLRAKSVPIAAIKLLGDMGETEQAVAIAERFAKNQPQVAAEPLLLAGDACRIAGDYAKAIGFYEKVLAGGNARNQEYERIYTGRAKDSIEAIRLFESLDLNSISDGKYSASTTGYNGAIQVEVTVQANRIDDVKVTSHNEKQFYSALTDTPAKIIKKQSVQGIDATSRATITSQAIVNATAKALATAANE